MTIALPPLVPMSTPRYRCADSILDAKGATWSLARRELACKGDGLIDEDDIANLLVLFLFFFFASATPRLLAMLLPMEQKGDELIPEALEQPNCDGERAAAADAASASGMRKS